MKNTTLISMLVAAREWRIMKNTTLISTLVAAFFATGLLLAGSLTPSEPPAPTMVTLQQLYDKLGAPADVARTGQTGCWNAAGTPIACLGTGQDGALVKGASVSQRFTDNGNGTVQDHLTGLIWLKNATCFPLNSWTNALANSNTLSAASAPGACGLTDGSAAGSWRLPNVKELQSLIDFGQTSPALPSGNPFTGVLTSPWPIWSSTTVTGTPNTAWYVNPYTGLISTDSKTNSAYVWPVRGGQ
jgi:hypothetical protein